MLAATFCIYDKPGIVGGPTSWILWLLPELRNFGIESTCLVLLHTGEPGPVSAALEKGGFRVISTQAHRYTEDRVRWILEQLREHRCDVFVPNEVPAAYHAARWVREAGIPTVGILHTDGAASKATQDLFVFGKPAFSLNALVCVSMEIERQVLSRQPRNTGVHRIPYGAHLPVLEIRPHPEILRIAYVGRLAEEQKRIGKLAGAFCRAVAEVPGTEAVLYGDGPERGVMERVLIAEGKDLPVSWGGRLEHDQVIDALRKIDVIVLLSDYEGLPVSLMEAMACGCVPVCLRAESGIPELVEHDVTGLLVDDRGDGFVEAIRRLREEDGLWKRLATGARSRIEEAYSHDVCVRGWSEMLHELARAARPSLIRIPKFLGLQPANAAIEFPADRIPRSLPFIRFCRRSRMALGRARRRLLGQPLP
jgi:colanic acid/amylovoran biosynthesis glycosyltransferase